MQYMHEHSPGCYGALQPAVSVQRSLGCAQMKKCLQIQNQFSMFRIAHDIVYLMIQPNWILDPHEQI